MAETTPGFPKLDAAGNARITFVLAPEQYVRFRDAVARAKGPRKGAVSEALAEAIDLWMREEAGGESGQAGRRGRRKADAD